MHNDPPPPVLNAVTPEPWVDMRTLAKHVGFSEKATRRMVERGEIQGGKAFKCGKKTYWRFRLSVVDALIPVSYTHLTLPTIYSV